MKINKPATILSFVTILVSLYITKFFSYNYSIFYNDNVRLFALFITLIVTARLVIFISYVLAIKCLRIKFVRQDTFVDSYDFNLATSTIVTGIFLTEVFKTTQNLLIISVLALSCMWFSLKIGEFAKIY